MKLRNIIIILICAVLALFLLGFTGAATLAGGDTDSGGSDRLIGVFITREHIDLFDIEGYLNDNTDKLMTGGEISGSDSAAYQGRLYAVLKESPVTDEYTGETGVSREYVFEGIEGISYFAATITDENGSTYLSASGNDSITDGHTALNRTDAGDSITMEGTIYVSTGIAGDAAFYFNPVYQEESGAVYTMTGNGTQLVSQAKNDDGSLSAGEMGEGMAFSHELSEERSVTVNGETQTVGTSVNVRVSFIDESESVAILQYSSDGALLKRGEYAPGMLPDSLAAEENTAYIIVEACKKAPGSVTRQLFQAGDGALNAFVCRDDDICVKSYCNIDWGD